MARFRFSKTNSELYRAAARSLVHPHSADTWFSIASGGIVFVALRLYAWTFDAGTFFVTSAGAGLAVSATVLTALSIVAALFDAPYRKAMQSANAPVVNALSIYFAVILTSLACVVVAFGSLVIDPKPESLSFDICVSLTFGLVLASIWGLLSLAKWTIFHAVKRADAQSELPPEA
jgi:hypothetical protein